MSIWLHYIDMMATVALWDKWTTNYNFSRIAGLNAVSPLLGGGYYP